MTIDTKRGRELYAAATPGEWSGYRMVHADRGDDMSPEECGEYVCNSVRKSALESGSNAFLAILCQKQDGPADVCHVGNGPTSPANCAWIAWAHSNAPALLDAAEECERLRAERDAEKRRADEAERNYAACAHAIGIEHEPETGPTAPGPVKAVVWHIKEALSQAMDRQDAVIRADEAEREREAMRDALRAIAHAKADSPVEDDETLVFHMGEVARAALAGKGGG